MIGGVVIPRPLERARRSVHILDTRPSDEGGLPKPKHSLVTEITDCGRMAGASRESGLSCEGCANVQTWALCQPTEGMLGGKVLVLLMRRARLKGPSDKKFSDFVDSLPEGYRPILGPSLEQQAERLGATAANLRQDALPTSVSVPASYMANRNLTRHGEVVTDGENLYVVTIQERLEDFRIRRLNDGSFVEEPSKSTYWLMLHFIGQRPDAEAFSRIADSASSLFGVRLKPYYFESARFAELKAEGRQSAAQPTQEELLASRVIADRDTRTMATAVKSTGGLLLSDMARQLPSAARGRTTQIHQALEAAGLVSSEVVVVCKKTQAQSARAPSIEVLTKLSQQGLRCACGKPVEEERIEEAVAATDLARSLLDGSRWFGVLLIEALTTLGVSLSQILMEQKAGGDEMDCLADISGELAFFELKDKEFNLGNAYSFGAKIGIVRPNHPIIITTEHVGQDAREHFDRASQVTTSSYATSVLTRNRQSENNEVRYIEGIDHLMDGLESLATEIYAADAQTVLGEALPFGSPDGAALVALVSQVASPEPAPKRKRVRSRARSRTAPKRKSTTSRKARKTR